MAPPTPPSPSRPLAATPDPSPRRSSAPRGSDAPPDRTGWPVRRVAIWSAVAAAVILGIYFYFAYSRSLVPLRVGS